MGGGAGSSEISTTRTSKTGWLKDSDHPTVASLTRRISLVTGLAADTEQEDAELLQVANYMNGGHYNPHSDYVMREKAPDHVSFYSLFARQQSRPAITDDLSPGEESLHRRPRGHLDVLSLRGPGGREDGLPQGRSRSEAGGRLGCVLVQPPGGRLSRPADSPRSLSSPAGDQVG